MPDTLSVVIPTYNRAPVLKKSLEALFGRGRKRREFEVIVVDDGSADETAEVVRRAAESAPVKVHYLFQENAGAGAARNTGLKRASGDVVLFMDDDIIAAPGMPSEHMRYHNMHPDENVAVLGMVTLSPEIPATPLNLEHAVHMWGSIRDGEEVSWRHFFTGNMSVKRSFLLENDLLFDERLRNYEDTEFGYRSAGKGMRIIHNARALGYHYHHMDLPAFVNMSRNYGYAIAILHDRYPELRDELSEYLVFSWHNPPARVLRDLLRPVVLNRLSVEALLLAARLLERHDGGLAAHLSRRIANYHERKGYRMGLREPGKLRENSI